MSAEATARLPYRALRLLYLTLGYNVLEGFIAIGSGVAAGSIALVGFGLDSFIEVFAAAVVVWRLRSDAEGEAAERIERRSLRLIGVTFFLLAAYIIFEAIGNLVFRIEAEESWLGIGLAIVSLIVMPVLAWAKLRLARQLGSPALRAEAVETLVCAYLSFALLLGLGANALWGLWWADPIAALAMTPLVLKEGREAWRGEDT